MSGCHFQTEPKTQLRFSRALKLCALQIFVLLLLMCLWRRSAR